MRTSAASPNSSAEKTNGPASVGTPYPSSDAPAYVPFFAATDQPPIWLNAEIMAQYRPQMQKFYYDPKKYKSYLEQLGIPYPTVREKITP